MRPSRNTRHVYLRMETYIFTPFVCSGEEDVKKRGLIGEGRHEAQAWVLEDLEKTCAGCCLPLANEHGIGEAREMGTIRSELARDLF